MDKQRMSNIPSSVQMNPRDRKDFIDELSKAGGVNSETPIIETLNGNELIPVFDGANKAVSVKFLNKSIEQLSQLEEITIIAGIAPYNFTPTTIRFSKEIVFGDKAFLDYKGIIQFVFNDYILYETIESIPVRIYKYEKIIMPGYPSRIIPNISYISEHVSLKYGVIADIKIDSNVFGMTVGTNFVTTINYISPLKFDKPEDNKKVCLFYTTYFKKNNYERIVVLKNDSIVASGYCKFDYNSSYARALIFNEGKFEEYYINKNTGEFEIQNDNYFSSYKPDFSLTDIAYYNKDIINNLDLTKDYTCQLALTNKTLLGTYYNGTFMAFSEGKIVRYNIDSEGNVTLDLSIDPFALEARIAALENPTTE